MPATGAGMRLENHRRGENRSPASSLGGEANQRIVRSSPAAAVTGLAGLVIVGSNPPFAAVSVMRLAIPMAAINTAHTSETTTILRWVVRSAVSKVELVITPSPGLCAVSRGRGEEGSSRS